MRRLILISGDLAAGKSTYSHVLGEKFSLPVFNKDTVKEILGDDIGFADRTENRRLSVAAVDLMIHVFAALAKTGSDAVLEANFRTEELTRIGELAEQYGYEQLFLYFQADVDVIYDRFMARKTAGRHPVHLSAGLEDKEKFRAYIEEQRRLSIPPDALIVDASDFSYQSDEALLSRIGSFLGK